MKKTVLGIIIFWTVITVVLVLFNALPSLVGKEVLLKTVPVDPRDLLRGDYVVLNYEISTPPRMQKGNFSSDSTVYVVLDIDKDNIATVRYVSDKIPRNEFFIKGKVRNKWSPRVEYGIESYFVKEGTGLELEQKLRSGAYAKVAIDKNGNAKVKELVY